MGWIADVGKELEKSSVPLVQVLKAAHIGYMYTCTLGLCTLLCTKKYISISMLASELYPYPYQ